MSAPVTDRTWLLELLGPEALARATGPLTDEQRRRVDAVLDSWERNFPANAALMAATDEERPAVLQRLLEQLG